MQLTEFTNIILPLKDKLFRTALCIVRNKEEAEDIVQEIMLRAWKGKGDLKYVQNITAYCITMTKNLALDKLRKKDFKTLSLEIRMHEESEIETPFGNMVENEQTELIHKLIDNLPINKRLLIQLRDIEGASYKQIAQILNMTESQVKTNLFRVRQELKKLFNAVDSYGQL